MLWLCFNVFCFLRGKECAAPKTTPPMLTERTEIALRNTSGAARRGSEPPPYSRAASEVGSTAAKHNMEPGRPSLPCLLVSDCCIEIR